MFEMDDAMTLLRCLRLLLRHIVEQPCIALFFCPVGAGVTIVAALGFVPVTAGGAVEKDLCVILVG